MMVNSLLYGYDSYKLKGSRRFSSIRGLARLSLGDWPNLMQYTRTECIVAGFGGRLSQSVVQGSNQSANFPPEC